MDDVIRVEYITHHGREFSVRYYYDQDSSPPWEQDCGVGVVRRERGSYEKRPWEAILFKDRWVTWVYDFRATREKALSDGWGLGLGEPRLSELAKKLGRTPTEREILSQSIELDFRRMQCWLHNEWHYIGLVITDIESGDANSLWGIESDCEEHIQAIIHELASELRPLASREECCVLSDT